MEDNQKEIQTIQQKLKGVKNEDIRSKAMFILRALQSGNVTLTAAKFGCSRRKFYFWIKRLRQTNYDINSLANRSTAPKGNSRIIPEETIQLAIQVRDENYNIGAKNTSLLLEARHNIKIHASTLGYIFKRRNISKQYRK